VQCCLSFPLPFACVVHGDSGRLCTCDNGLSYKVIVPSFFKKTKPVENSQNAAKSIVLQGYGVIPANVKIYETFVLSSSVSQRFDVEYS
jgi:hypothetical protein